MKEDEMDRVHSIHGKEGKAHKDLVGKPEGNKSPGMSRCR
jgi:hypothetical protein